LYLTPTKAHWICDIETDGLRDEATQIFVICVENAVTPEKKSFRTKEEFNAWLPSDAILVGHNLVAFDVPLINRFWGSRVPIRRCVDTLLLSMLYSPSLSGGHSLEAWGERVRLPKFKHKDFTQYSEEMRTYCERDTEITKQVFNRLTARMRTVGFTERGAALETYSWHIIQNKQRRHGFPFDYERAHKLYVDLRAQQERLKDELYKQWPPELKCVKECKRPFKQDGSPSANYARHLEQYPSVELCDGDGYKCFDWVEFNLGSPQQRVAKLLEAGWKPLTYTKVTKKGGGGNPKVDEESLIRFTESSGNEDGKRLAKWMMLQGRCTALNDWMNNYNEKTGAIHGQLWLAGSLRYRSDKPNTQNIPAIRVNKAGQIKMGEEGSYSYETRDLWTCGNSNRYSLVGIDAKGIQLRILAHYLADEEFNKAILSEDPHSYNQKTWELDSRAKAKTILYAIVMGAGDAKVASEAGISLKDAKATKKQMFDRVPGFPKLIKKMKNEHSRTGRIKLCDGTPVLVPEDYRVIPYLLQGDESKIMKQASVYLDEQIRRKQIDARKVADVHDEWQYVVLTDQLELFIAEALACFPRAGQAFNYRIPIEGDAKVGKTWAETH
jgi:DNA polymerase-1